MTALILAALAVIGSAIFVVVYLQVRNYDPSVGTTDSFGVVRYSETRISSQLVPHLDEVELSDKSLLTFWAFDTSYFDNPEKCDQLCNGLRKWLTKGVSIHYIFSKQGIQAPSALIELANDFPNQLEIFLLPAECEDVEALEIANRFMYLHPNLFDLDANGSRAMWIEYRHAPDTTVANNVYFYDQEACQSPNATLKYNVFLKQLDYFKTICDKVPGKLRAA